LPAVNRLLAVLIASCALAVAGCGSSDDPEPEVASTATASAAATAEPANEFLPEGCEDVEQPPQKPIGEMKAPKEKLSRSKTYTATIDTTCGTIEVALDAKRAPVTGGSFKYLADQGFFDGLTFHRIVADFVIQGGDPNGDGSGGPGYSVEEAPPEDLKYEEGVVAMAKTGTEPTGTSGSQFFIVTGPSALSLTPDYALLGKVTKGLDVAKKISTIPSDQSSGQPAAVVVINAIKVTEG
jgi:peptidyl-prolyl cis-trans isomerase B (cyclophilin B)